MPVRQIVCRRCRRGGGTLRKAGDGYEHEECAKKNIPVRSEAPRPVLGPADQGAFHLRSGLILPPGLVVPKGGIGG